MSASSKTRQQQSFKIIVVIAIVGVVIAGAVAARLLFTHKNVTNFSECKAGGGKLLASYPEQCLINGKTYTDTPPAAQTSDYVGLSEESALAKAKQENVAARVVERDGASLPVTMDFVYNRHNLYVKDGKVVKVDIEGQAKDN